MEISLTPKQLQIIQEASHTYLGEFEEAGEYAPPEWKQEYLEADELHKFIATKLNELNFVGTEQ
jgi:hypothetical protein